MAKTRVTHTVKTAGEAAGLLIGIEGREVRIYSPRPQTTTTATGRGYSSGTYTSPKDREVTCKVDQIPDLLAELREAYASHQQELTALQFEDIAGESDVDQGELEDLADEATEIQERASYLSGQDIENYPA